MTKKITANIWKIFYLNFGISGIIVNISENSFFSYDNTKNYFEITVTSILICMFLSIGTAHICIIFDYIKNLFQRYKDSGWSNGKTTKLNNKLKYEKIYVGPEFPIDERYAYILSNLCVTLFYGSSCPLIYLFFCLFLITTFIVDKYLIINYYKKPNYYNNYISGIVLNFFLFGIILYLFAVLQLLNNPYLFNYYQNEYYGSFEFYYNMKKLTYIFNPLYFITHNLVSTRTDVDYISNITVTFIVFLATLLILLILKYLLFFKINRGHSEILSIKNLINLDIGLVLSKNDLNKYYEFKKLEFFNCLININKNYNDDINYDYIISNYKKNLDYLRNCLELKNENEQRNNSYNINDIEENNKVKENTIDPGLIYNNENLMMKGDPSYNLAFLENYEAYSIFDLLY